MSDLIDLVVVNTDGLIVVSIAILLDMLTGVIKACLSHQLSSSEFRTGLLKKVLDYVLIIVAFSLDYLLGTEYLGNAVLYSLILMEFYSVIENVELYIPLPEALKKVLSSLREKE